MAAVDPPMSGGGWRWAGSWHASHSLARFLNLVLVRFSSMKLEKRQGFEIKSSFVFGNLY